MAKILKNDSIDSRAARAVASWLLIGVGMIMIQILLGGITRLTESGLSITEWKPVTGTLPPLDLIAWQAEFDKYKGTDQFKYVHQNFTLSEFKSIFFLGMVSSGLGKNDGNGFFNRLHLFSP